MNTTPIFDNIPLTQIIPSKTNPRKYFDEAALQELAESIKTQGVAQPILVRPKKGKRKTTAASYEIIAGERRFRASKIAGMETIPALIRELTDHQALEIQVIENLQRADLHPLEEAEGYEQLMRLHKMTADDLAVKVGKSKSYVYTRLKLLALEPDARQAFYDSKLTLSTAILIARIPVPKLQKKAVKEIVGLNDNPMSTKSAAAYIQRNFMLQLDEAPFPVDDASLVVSAGSCAACLKRTGNQPELFGDISCADTCTDPECFNQKRAAHVAVVKTRALESGQKVLTGEEAKKIRPNAYCITGDFVDLDSRCYRTKDNKSYRELLGEDLPETFLLEDPHTANNLITLVKRDDVNNILVEKGILEDTSIDDLKRQKERELREKEEEKRFRKVLFDEIHKTSPAENPVLQETILRISALEMIDYSKQDFIQKLYGWEENSTDDNDEAVNEKEVEALNLSDLLRLIMDIVLVDEVRWMHTEPTLLFKIAKLAGIDPEAIREKTAQRKKTQG